MDTSEILKKKLLYLYRCQTREEQDSEQTIENNGVGFNALDAEFCSSVSRWILSGKYLTNKQFAAIEKILPKYKRQLEDGEWQDIVLPKISGSTDSFKPQNNKLELDAEGRLVFTPVTYPSTQIKTLSPFYWKDKAWHQAHANVNKGLVDRICRMFDDVEVSEEVQTAIAPVEVQLPEEVQNHSQLFPFQKESIQFLLSSRYGMLCLAPGLGKSPCAIFAAKGLQHILVVSPLSLLYNWRNEIKKWADEKAQICYKTEKPDPQAKWVITNYDTVRLHPELFLQDWDAVVIDESVLVKNRKAKRTKTIKELVSRTKPKYCWLLSGAPITRLYDDLWAQLNILYPQRFSSYWRFTENYCHVTQNQWGWQILANKKGADEVLKQDLQDIYFARTQDQVLDLPEWIVDNLYIPMLPAQDKMYAQMENEFIAELGDGETLLAPNVLSQLVRLVQLASNPVLVGGTPGSAKWDAVAEILEYETLPAIVWTSFIKTAVEIEKQLSKKFRVGVLTGKTAGKDRQDIVDKFQTGELDVIIAHPGVGKFGYTLTAARTAIYLERSYNGDDYYQSLHRIRRIGTEFSPHVLHLISTRTKGSQTVDHVIDKILQTRRDSVTKLTTGELKEMFVEVSDEG